MKHTQSSLKKFNLLVITSFGDFLMMISMRKEIVKFLMLKVNGIKVALTRLQEK